LELLSTDFAITARSPLAKGAWLKEEYANYRVSVHLSGQVLFARVMVVQSAVASAKNLLTA
jgi:hypothetical protein